MAAGNASKILGDIGERHLECSICTNRFKEPKMLHCFHSFCLQCLQDLSKGQDPQRMKLKCPLCRRETVLSGNGVADFPNNFTLSALVEEFAVQEKLLEGEGSGIICQECDEENCASSFCMDCAHFLCPECQRAHERVRLTKTHKIYTLAQLQSGEVTYKSPLRDAPKCQKHPDQSLNIYCNTCQMVTCTTCSVLDHEKHSRSGFSEAFNECKQEVAALTKQAEEKQIVLKIVKNNTEEARKKLETRFADIIQKISTKAENEVAKIRERELELKQEAVKIYTERIETFDTIQVINNDMVHQAEIMLNQVGHLLSQASCCEILDLQQNLLDNLNEVTEQEPEEVPDKLSFMDFQDTDDRSLGRLVLKDEWNLQTSIPIVTHGSRQQDIRLVHDVTAFSNREIVTVDRGHKQLIYFVPTSNPQVPFIPQKLQTAVLKDPTHVAVNKADQLIVLDGDAVKTLSREYQLLSQFRPGEKSNSKPTCLAVDDSNLIGVGYLDKEEISLHNPDGSLIRRLPAPCIGNRLTICRKQFIYIDWMSKVRSVDYIGAVVDIHVEGKTSGLEDRKLYRSICCDSHGSLFIICAIKHPLPVFFPLSQEIQQLSPDWKYNRTIKENIPQAYDITFTSAGDLLVAEGQYIHIYCRI